MSTAKYGFSARSRPGRVPGPIPAALPPALAALALGLAALALLLVPVSCGRPEPLVGLFLYNEEDPYIEEFARQIQEEAAGRFLIAGFDAGNSQPIQNEQLEGFLRRKPFLAMINPVDRLASYALVRRLEAEDVPIVFFNREPLARDMALWENCYYVGAKAEQSGQMQADLVMELFGGDPAALNGYDRNGDGVIQLIVLKGEQGHQDAELRTRELLRSFEEGGFRLELLAIEVANWNYDEAYEKIGTLERSHRGRIELIASNNDAMALGAIARLRQMSYFKDNNRNGAIDRYDSSWLPVVGIDGLEDAERSIEDGYLYGTVMNDSRGMAKAMVELASLLASGGDPASSSGFPYRLEEGKYIWIDYQPFVRND